MNRKAQDQAKAAYAARRKARNLATAHAAEEREAREAALKRALSARQAKNDIAWMTPEYREVLEARAPRLLASQLRDSVRRLVELPAIRPISTWSPHGKAPDTVFRSLASHLLAAFPVPAIVWNAFGDDNAAVLVPLAAYVASGGSLFEWAKTHITVRLTRKMCHELLATPAEFSLTDAIRRVQARAAGLDRRVFDAFRVTRNARRIGSSEEEAFWWSVLEWVARQTMLDPSELGPLTDYIDARRREDPTFSMKGRSALVLLRAMREWHGELARAKAISGTLFNPSGLANASYQDSRRENGATISEVWTIREILTARALADEGKRMGHCVYSYAWQIERGNTSIWSVQMEDGEGETGRWHMVTVEVNNARRSVVQARGRFNRVTTPKEQRMIARWAHENGLTMAIGSW